jgi:hypothetical protein
VLRVLISSHIGIGNNLTSFAPCKVRLYRITRSCLMIVAYRDRHHLITTGGEGHFYKRDEDIGYWLNGQWVSDYNYNGDGRGYS